MASLTPAVVQNENLHIHRGKGVNGAKAEVPKPAKTAQRQDRKALRDLSQTGKAPLSTALKGSTVKNKSAVRGPEVTKNALKNIILTDDEINKCHEWAKEGIEQMHFSGNDLQKLRSDQLEERVTKEVAKVMSSLHVWMDTWFGLETPIKEVPSDTEDVLKLDFEPEVLPPSLRATWSSKLGDEEIEDLFELDYDSLYFRQPFEIKLEEECDSDDACL